MDTIADRDEMLAQARERLLELVRDAFLFIDETGRILDANDAAVEMYGYARDELLTLDVRRLRGPGAAHHFERLLSEVVEEGRTIETVQRRKDGTVFPAELSSRSLVFDQGRLIVSVVRDITERKRAKEELELKSMLLDATTDSVIVHYVEGGVVYVNEAACRLRGFTREEMLSMDQHEWVHPSVRHELESHLQLLLSGGSHIFESVDVRKDGTPIPVEVHAMVIELGGRVAIVSDSRDITERLEAEAKVRHMAYHDDLTGLPTRKLLDDRLGVALANARRHDDLLALMFMDLDGFKAINDEYGHATGDRVLVEVASRLGECTREGDTLARLGGDEFVLLVPRVSTEADALGVARKLVRIMKTPFKIDGEVFEVEVSVGLALDRGGTGSPEELLHRADLAMYEAKQAGVALRVAETA